MNNHKNISSYYQIIIFIDRSKFNCIQSFGIFHYFQLSFMIRLVTLTKNIVHYGSWLLFWEILGIYKNFTDIDFDLGVTTDILWPHKVLEVITVNIRV